MFLCPRYVNDPKKGAGEEIDEDRFYLLELADRRRRGDALTDEELDELAFFEGQAAKEQRYEEEYAAVLTRKEAGEEIDEDRFFLLDLIDRGRRGENLTEEELEEIAIFEEQVEQEQRYEEKYVALLAQREAGEDVDEDRLYFLELLERVRSGEDLTHKELDDVDFLKEQGAREQNYANEFVLLLAIKDAGGEVDEDRFYFLDLFDRKRHGAALNDNEINVIEMFLSEDCLGHSEKEVNLAIVVNDTRDIEKGNNEFKDDGTLEQKPPEQFSETRIIL